MSLLHGENPLTLAGVGYVPESANLPLFAYERQGVWVLGNVAPVLPFIRREVQGSIESGTWLVTLEN
jgi:hypothetical protein